MDKTFTFAIGVTVRIVGVSPQAVLAIRRKLKQPKPPMIEVEVAGQKVLEPDMQNEEWKEKLEEWRFVMTERVQAVYFEDGLELIDVDQTVLRDIADAIRQKFAERDSEIKGSDKYVFIAYHCIRGTHEMDALMRAIRGATETTEEGIAEATATFREPDAV